MFNVDLGVIKTCFSILITCFAAKSKLIDNLTGCLIKLRQCKMPLWGCSCRSAYSTTKPNWISAHFSINHCSSPPVFCTLTVKNDWVWNWVIPANPDLRCFLINATSPSSCSPTYCLRWVECEKDVSSFHYHSITLHKCIVESTGVSMRKLHSLTDLSSSLGVYDKQICVFNP